MKLKAGMIIEATVQDADKFNIFLTYDNVKGVIYVEDLAWIVSPRLEDYIIAENLLKVQVMDVLEPSKNRRFCFFSSRRTLEPTPLIKMVGYWYSKFDKHYPYPRVLVDPNWYCNKRGKIIDYLNSGWTHTQWRGLSFCRFECNPPAFEMGSKCLTDGEWVWPEGLVHYIEKHNVQLPEEFIDTMRTYNWNAKNRYEGPHQVPRGDPNPSFWLEWCSHFK